MKTYGMAPLAVIVLWLGLSSVWMGQSAIPSAALADTTDSLPEASVAAPGAAAMPAGPVMIDLSQRAPLGPIMTALVATPTAGFIPDAPVAPSLVTSAETTVGPPPTWDDTLLRMQALETRLTLALEALERRGGVASQGSSTVQAPSFLRQVATVVGSAPVIGFLVMLLLALAVAAWGQPLRENASLIRLKATLHRLTAPRPGAADQSPPALALPDFASSGARPIYGQIISHTLPNGQSLQAGVFDENQVRAAAGLTLALGAVAFSYAYLAKIYLPIQAVTTLFFIEFLIRVSWGIARSPLGLIAGLMTRRDTPHWVSAKPKRFAWSLGLAMSLAMMLITNGGIRGPLPLTICLICLTLMWLEAVLGLCLGCEMHRFLVRWGWMQPDKDFEICSNGACTVPAHPQFAR